MAPPPMGVRPAHRMRAVEAATLEDMIWVPPNNSEKAKKIGYKGPLFKELPQAERKRMIQTNERVGLELAMQMRDRGALFVISHSAGKDSQAMAAYVRNLVPEDQLLVLHANLAGVEHPGTLEHIRENTWDLPLVIVEAIWDDGTAKDFDEMWLRRGVAPSPTLRQCTSDLKTGPIRKGIRHYLKSHPEFNELVVDCVGLRADESPDRAAASTRVFFCPDDLSKAGKEWCQWFPIADWTIQQVFDEIDAAGQEAFPTYEARRDSKGRWKIHGMTRVSCQFCIMAKKSDQTQAAELYPERYAVVIALERHTGHTMHAKSTSKAERAAGAKNTKPLPLDAMTGVKPDEKLVRRHLKMLQENYPDAPFVAARREAAKAKKKKAAAAVRANPGIERALHDWDAWAARNALHHAWP